MSQINSYYFNGLNQKIDTTNTTSNSTGLVKSLFPSSGMIGNIADAGMGLIGNLLGGITGDASSANSTTTSLISTPSFVYPQALPSYGYSMMMPYYGYMPTTMPYQQYVPVTTSPTTSETSNTSSNSGLIGIGNAMSQGNVGMLGVSGLLGGALSAVGTAAGGLAQGVHALAEDIIAFTGLGPIFGPLVDDPIIHPLLWDPLSAITGYDVSKHPNGVPDVSDPLGVRSNNTSANNSSSSNSGLGGLLSGLLNLI